MNTVWAQWDKQQEVRLQNEAFWKLNNLYLKIERRVIPLTMHRANEMRILVDEAYGDEDFGHDFWKRQFEKLSGWHDC